MYYGSEFISKVMDRWAYDHRVELDFSRPGRPIDNAKIESFNGRLGEEWLNAHWFLSLDDARRKIEAWHGDWLHHCCAIHFAHVPLEILI